MKNLILVAAIMMIGSTSSFAMCEKEVESAVTKLIKINNQTSRVVDTGATEYLADNGMMFQYLVIAREPNGSYAEVITYEVDTNSSCQVVSIKSDETIE